MLKRVKIYVLILISVLFACLFGAQAVKSKTSDVQAETSYFAMEEGTTYRSRWIEGQCGLTYTARISKSKIEEFKVNNGTDNSSIKLFIIPYEYVTGLGGSTVDRFASAKGLINSGKYVEGFKEAERQGAKFWYGIVENVGVVDNNSEYLLIGGLKGIQTSNMNRRYFGIYYIEGEKNGETIREYAEKPSRIGDSAEVTHTVKAGRTSNSMAYVVTTIGTNGKDAWEIEHINTFIKRSVIDGVKKSISASEKEEIDEEGIESKGLNEIVEVEMNDVTYGDDYFEYKIKGENLNKKGTSNFVEITSKLDFNVQWDFGSSGLSSKSVSSLKKGQKGIEITSAKDNATATVYIGTYSKSLTFNVDELEVTEGVSAGISVSDYKVDRVSDINSLAVKATVQYGASGKRVSEKSYEFTPMIVGSGFGKWTATVTGSGNFSGTISATFNITQNVYKITKGSIVNGDITISPTESPCDETITLTNTAKTGYKFVNYIVDGTEQTENTFIMPNKNIVVGANFTAENYKITYETNGGTFNGTKVESYDYGVGATLSTNVTKTGYTFEGWYTNSNLSGTAVTKIGTTETGDKTFYAKWTAKSDVSYTIRYYKVNTTTKLANDTNVTGRTFNASETINAKTITGYTISGSNTQTITHDAYNKTYTFYYTANTYNVTYNGNGNTGGSTANSTHTYDVAQKLTTNGFIKTGYTFAGWATTANGEKVYSDGQSVTNLASAQDETVTLYAKWTGVTYYVKYDANGGTGTMDNTTHVYGTASALRANTFTRTGYTFGGWATSANGEKVYDNGASVSTLNSTSGGTTTLYAVWNAKSDVSYTIRYYKVNTTTKLAEDIIVTGRTFNASETIIAKTIAGYTISGSNTQTITHDAYNKTYTFYYTANTYTITYYSTNTTAYTTQSIKYASSYSLPTAPTKTGFAFVGWSQDENNTSEWSSGTQTCSGNKSWYAVWKKTWNFYDTSSTASESEAKYYQYNCDVSQSYTKANPARSGYTFLGYTWNGSATGTDITASVSAGSSNTTVTSSQDSIAKFYAVWQASKQESDTRSETGSTTDTITYDGNGKTGGSTSDTTVNITIYYSSVYVRSYNIRYNYDLSKNSGGVDYGSWTLSTKTETGRTRSATLANNGFSKTGHDFSKWAEGSANGTQYSAGANYTGESTTFYAIWTKSSYTVTLNTNSGTINAGNVTSYTYGTGVTLPTNVTRSGYTFNGWYASSDFSGSVVTSIGSTETGNKTYWAKWTINYTVTLKYYVDYGTGVDSLSGVKTGLIVDGTKTMVSTFTKSVMQGTTIGVYGSEHDTSKYGWQFYKLGGEYYSIYQSGEQTANRVTVNDNLEIGIYLSGKVNYRQNVISNHTVNLAGVYKSSDYVEGFDKGGVRDINGDFYMEVIIHNLAGSQSYTGNDWNSMAWRTFLLGFYDSYNPDCYRFIRLDNWSWASYSCGTWNYDINGSRDSSNWWGQMTTAQVMSLYKSGNMSLDIRITKVGDTMHVIYAVRHNGSEYRQYYKFTNMPAKLSMLYGAEDANFTVSTLNLDIKDNSNYSYVGSTTGTGKTYGLGNGWNDNRNLFDIPRLAGNFVLKVEFKMDAMQNGDTVNWATCQGLIYTPGDLYKRSVTRYDWCITNEKSFASATTSSGWLYKCNGTGWDGSVNNGGFDENGTVSFQSVVDSATCNIEIQRSGTDISIKMWVLPDGKAQRYGVWYTASGCSTGILGFRLAEQSSTYTVTSYSIT